MIIALVIVAIVMYAAIFYLVHRRKQRIAAMFAEREAELAVLREEAIRTGKIITNEDLRIVRAQMKTRYPQMNRKQRRAEAVNFGKNFKERVKQGLE